MGPGVQHEPSCFHDDDLFCKTLLQEPGENRQIQQVPSFPENLNPEVLIHMLSSLIENTLLFPFVSKFCWVFKAQLLPTPSLNSS